MDDADDPRRRVDGVTATPYAVVWGTTLALLTLMEQYGELPGAAVAVASGWYILHRWPDR